MSPEKVFGPKLVLIQLLHYFGPSSDIPLLDLVHWLALWPEVFFFRKNKLKSKYLEVSCSVNTVLHVPHEDGLHAGVGALDDSDAMRTAARGCKSGDNYQTWPGKESEGLDMCKGKTFECYLQPNVIHKSARSGHFFYPGGHMILLPGPHHLPIFNKTSHSFCYNLPNCLDTLIFSEAIKSEGLDGWEVAVEDPDSTVPSHRGFILVPASAETFLAQAFIKDSVALS